MAASASASRFGAEKGWNMHAVMVSCMDGLWSVIYIGLGFSPSCVNPKSTSLLSTANTDGHVRRAVTGNSTGLRSVRMVIVSDMPSVSFPLSSSSYTAFHVRYCEASNNVTAGHCPLCGISGISCPGRVSSSEYASDTLWVVKLSSLAAPPVSDTCKRLSEELTPVTLTGNANVLRSSNVRMGRSVGSTVPKSIGCGSTKSSPFTAWNCKGTLSKPYWL
mmetsp:Transcript_1321/g.4440  ORF Transcript_1321/g.4440 Transcript_1321/m.4440 type:complete len:219 (+) Transcript_1321:2265-2921(+)